MLIVSGFWILIFFILSCCGACGRTHKQRVADVKHQQIVDAIKGSNRPVYGTTAATSTSNQTRQFKQQHNKPKSAWPQPTASYNQIQQV